MQSSLNRGGRPTLFGYVRSVAGAAAWAVGAVVKMGGVVMGVRRVVVEGDSMLPTLAPGDRLLVRRTRRIKVGDLVAVPDPRLRSRLLVKRVEALDGRWLTVAGDNERESSDSRHFGPLPRRSVRGMVLRRYAPSSRAGPVR
ncbi:MAG TPA: nickel-type superoxide dismutase maturation protease [Acidimicrobiales bacterium]|nr:nickel-type superoxide dismutase maturation protease [Acidimicrobiales bacterium]